VQALIALNVSRKVDRCHFRIIGHRNPQKETGLKNGSLHEGGGKAMTLKLSIWLVEQWLSKHEQFLVDRGNRQPGNAQRAVPHLVETNKTTGIAMYCTSIDSVVE
jgi:hypothetical protein